MTVVEFFDPEKWLGETLGPRYLQLQRRLEEAIDTGVLPATSSLPPERELAEITDLSRVTVRKAIQQLVADGRIEQRQGSGTFVCEPIKRMQQSLSHLTSFTEDMARRGMTTTSKPLERGIFAPTEEEARILGLKHGDEVARIYRLREADGSPMALERAAVPLDLLPNPLEVTTSLYEVLDSLGHKPARATQKISAVNLGGKEAHLLGLAEGAAGLSIERISYLGSGRVAELTHSLYRGDAYDFVAELNL